MKKRDSIRINLIVPKLSNQYSRRYVNKRLDKIQEKIVEFLWNNYKNVKIKTIESYEKVKVAIEKSDFQNCINIFIIDLGEMGINIEYQKMLLEFRGKTKGFELIENHEKSLDIFDGAIGGVIVDGHSHIYTKKVARELVFTANMAGCSFIGKSLVEAALNLENFAIKSEIEHISLFGAYLDGAINLIKRLVETFVSFSTKGKDIKDIPRSFGYFSEENIKKNEVEKKKKILAIHSSHFKKSNTLLLWDIVKKNLPPEKIEISQVSLAKDTVDDCRGCPHSTCFHYGEKSSCYYGGYIVDEVFPKVLQCDGIVIISPNYNDSLSGNLTSFINRLTALYKANSMDKKQVFAVIVSGYSGSDIIAEQIIGAMSMNKGFFLPSKFAIYARANKIHEIMQVENIEEKGRRFAENIVVSLEKNL